MAKSLIIALLFHGIAAAAVFAISGFPLFERKFETPDFNYIPIRIVKHAEKTTIRSGTQSEPVPEEKPKKAKSRIKPQPEPKKEKKPDEPKQPAQKPQGHEDGKDSTLTANDHAYLQGQIKKCWTRLPGGFAQQEKVLRVRFRFNSDGSLMGNPRVISRSSSSSFRSVSENAIRAIIECQPYDLPSRNDPKWKDIIVNFVLDDFRRP